ncbi:MAG: hypothetical protein MJZ04_02525 [Bacteroidales bacterium]|nr:hypothetical protein [Bacteroidales bacterium]
MMRNLIPVLALAAVLCSCGPEPQKTITSVADVDSLAEALKAEILNSESRYTVAGDVYYVSCDGDDAADGLSEKTPVRSIEKVNEMPLKPGDVVLFRRGDLWRGHIVAQDGVTYSAYGKGPKPRLYGSPFNSGSPEHWAETDAEGVWALTTPLPDDVGTLVFNDGDKGCAYKVLIDVDCDGNTFHLATGEPFHSYRDLHRDLDLYHDPETGVVYLCSLEGNPGSRFGSIEMLTHGHTFAVLSVGAKLDNFCVKYTGAHGVAGRDGVTSLEVTNCEFGWIGGSIQHQNPAPTVPGKKVHPTRYGNGIELWGTCDHYLVDHNYVYQCYDAGVTHQWHDPNPGPVQKDITYTRNLVQDCVYCLEYFLTAPGDSCLMKDVLVKDNIFRRAGDYGWGFQRPDKGTPAIIKAWKGHEYPTENFRIENNIIDRGNPHLLDVHAGKPEWMPVCSGNIFLQDAGVPVGTEIEKGAEIIEVK